MKKKIYLLIAISTISVSAQVGIGVDAAQINASAQLDVSSTTKGLLTPRMTELQRKSINQPAAGLLVYQTDSIAGFYYYDGSAWKLNLGLSPDGTIGQVLTTDGAGNAGWATAATGTPGVDLTTNQTVDGLKTFSSDVLINGITVGTGKYSGMFPEESGNTAVGTNVLSSNENGKNNTAVGTNALVYNTGGNDNTANGVAALLNNITGSKNTANGLNALAFNTVGNDNTASGQNALLQNEGSSNTANGSNSLFSNTIGSNNTALGFEADVSDGDLTNATAIGNQAKVAASNTIQLGNAAITAVKTSGQLTTGTVTYPNTNGTPNQVLTTDGAGNATWATAAGGSSVTVGAVGAATTNGASITAGELSLSPADGTNPGIVTTGAQTIAGAKTFTDKIKMGAVTYPNTVGTANQVLTTDGAGNATWATAAGGSSITMGAVGGANANGASITAGLLSLSPAGGTGPGIVTTSTQTFAGIKTFTSKAVFSGTDGFVANGGPNGSLPASSSGARMMWAPSKKAFRAGSIDGTQWDNSNVGINSIATGFNTIASGYASTALGYSTKASGDISTAMGYSTTAKSLGETVIGMYNTDATALSTVEYNLLDRLFVIGNGSGPIIDAATGEQTAFFDRKDALVMLKNGNTTFSGTVTAPSFPTSSDKRLKRNITPLKQSIAAVMQLNPVSYEKKQSLASSDYNMKENGFIAQELQRVMPTLVTEGTDKDKLLSVNYIALIPVLTKAIQEQQKEIETLKALVEKLINQQKQ